MFTPLEFGTVGLSEEKAIESYGENNIEVSSFYFPIKKFKKERSSLREDLAIISLSGKELTPVFLYPGIPCLLQTT